MSGSESLSDRGESSAAGDLKRSTSCPDERHITEEVLKKRRQKDEEASSAAASASVRRPKVEVEKFNYPDKEDAKVGFRKPVEAPQRRELVSSGIQTDELVVFPYEHLFPMVLPPSFVDTTVRNSR